MKLLHKNNLYCWSDFNQERNIDFHGYLWLREAGNVLIDPLPLSDHDMAHLKTFGPVSHILITSSSHVRDGENIATITGAEIWGPVAEQHNFPVSCSRWLDDDDFLFDAIQVFSLDGSKTPGELAFLLENETLITGDLIRCHQAGRLCILPDDKLTDKANAVSSVKRLAELDGIQAVLPGDGWPVFNQGDVALKQLLKSVDS